MLAQFPHTLSAAPRVDKEDLKQLRSRIETLQKELTDTEESKSEVADALRHSERAISVANRRLSTLGQEQRKASDKRSQLQAQSEQVAKNIEAQQSQLSKLLYRQYIAGSGQKEYLGLLLNQQEPNQIARNMYYYGYLSRARMEGIGTLRVNLQQLDSLTRESREKSAELAVIQARQAESKKELEREKTEHANLLARISLQADQQRREISKLKQDEERLSRLVEKLAKLLARKNRRTPPAPPASLSNDSLPDASTDGRPFSALKGRLSLPVRGELANRFGSPRADGGLTWKGLFIRSAVGEDVKAIATGRIVFADWLRGFGNLLIVDHGGSYMSLYGNNETIHKQVGDSVRSGDTIASVGNSSGIDPDAGLYFELRHQGKPFDPLIWVRIK
ncbi:Septal ring factor EnvC, activator of murein hydrolases AmiA and AmiB [Nitrosovibrio tenuis]|uniref:Septal ring factor EnvC, activator of murein hydrolases AmiA and AmiB n=2 Tax=Nitrosovibrio tenuis TaxID=1233 RepID=A0A1H7QJC9_9PROT|nr:Septal ring factor EnvC, activator of murein hydrolases AmiA and AmiB [Nitrosovibrio tenuis]